MSDRLTNFNNCWIKTITFDNGKEFAYHHKIGKDLNAETYFTRPYTSQDKGTVENRIGVIRRFFPKKTDLRNVTEKRIKEVEKLLSVTANDYWNYHYVPDDPTAFKKKTLGKQMIQNILINTVIPVLYAYGLFNKNEVLKSKALQWLEKTGAEKNNITKGFQSLGIENKNAFDSQALIRLKNKYCDHLLCLQCAIGNKILNAK